MPVAPWLDTLYLPLPEEALETCRRCGDGAARYPDAPSPAMVPARYRAPEGDGALAMYRWLVGHHAAVCIWRMLGDVLAMFPEPASPGSSPDRQRADFLALLLQAYSATLIYAGSCTAEIYKGVVRPKMIARNPAMSGRWARDYERVRQMLPPVARANGRVLRTAYITNRLVHMQQAHRLVPGNVSLLQEAGRATDMVTDRERNIFDDFFGIERTRICEGAFYAQLALRVAQSLRDLEERPLSISDYSEPSRGIADRVQPIFNGLIANVRARLPWISSH